MKGKNSTQQQLTDILNIVTHIKDNAVSKDTFDTEIKGIKSTMVTKNYLDEKLANHAGNVTALLRKEDSKLKALVGVLYDNAVIDEQDMKKMYEMKPFPSIPLP